MIKIAHEAPLSIINRVRKVTDYDYALVHLLDENEEYRKQFYSSMMMGREVILDNSIFELGKAFSGDNFAYWIDKLRPHEYIVPDSLENISETIINFFTFTRNYTKLPGKKIGVLQGKNYKELCKCYTTLLELGAEKIAISFDYSYYETLYDFKEIEDDKERKLKKWCEGRKYFLTQLTTEPFFRKNIPLHLLGCSLPQEFIFYKTGFPFIESVDTSNPIVHGIKNISYTPEGTLDRKESQKLCELIDYKPTAKQDELIFSNIRRFKKNFQK